MIQIPDDPIISRMEQTGFPPWIDPDWEGDEDGVEEYSPSHFKEGTQFG